MRKKSIAYFIILLIALTILIAIKPITAITGGGTGANVTVVGGVADSTNPLIEYLPFTEDNNTYLNRNYIFINVSIIEANFNNITFLIFNTTSKFNESFYTNQTNQINISINNLNERYSYNVTVRDSSNNKNTTETRIITFDNISPNITDILILPLTPFENVVMNISYFLTEINPSNCTLRINNKIYNDLSPLRGTNAFYDVEFIGTYNYNITCTDLANNQFTTDNKQVTVVQLSGSGGGTGGGGGDGIINQTVVKIDNYTIILITPDKWKINKTYPIILEFILNNKSISLDKNPEFLINPETKEIYLDDIKINDFSFKLNEINITNFSNVNSNINYIAYFKVTQNAKKRMYNITATLTKDNKKYQISKEILVTDDSIVSKIKEIELKKIKPIYWIILIILIVLILFIIFKRRKKKKVSNI